MSTITHIPWLIVTTLLTSESSPILIVKPEHVDVTNNPDVLVTCTHNIQPLDTVYSLLICRDQNTLAVCFREDPCEVMVDNVSVENSSVSNMTFLQVKVRQVTCDDRGDYSCKMAVRQSYRNMKLVSNTVHLNVTGKPGQTDFNSPIVISRNRTHTRLQLSCFTLQRVQVSGWTWALDNNSSPGDTSACVYSETNCLYRCYSELQLDVPLEQDSLGVVCSIEGMVAQRVFNISGLLIKPQEEGEEGEEEEEKEEEREEDKEEEEDIKSPSMKMAFLVPSEKRNITNHLLTLALALAALAFITVLTVIRLSRKHKMCKRIKVKNKQFGKGTNNPNEFEHLETELDESNILLNENLTLITKGTKTF